MWFKNPSTPKPSQPMPPAKLPRSEMTLRDHFASVALAELLRNDMTFEMESQCGPEVVAQLAYKIADYMLAAREAGGAA